MQRTQKNGPFGPSNLHHIFVTLQKIDFLADDGGGGCITASLSTLHPSSYTPVQNDIRELLICMMDRFCNGKTSNVASSPQWLSGPLHVVKLGGPMDDKFITCAHERNWHFNRPRIIRHANQKLAIIYQGTTIFPSIKQTLSQLPIQNGVNRYLQNNHFYLVHCQNTKKHTIMVFICPSFFELSIPFMAH